MGMNDGFKMRKDCEAAGRTRVDLACKFPLARNSLFTRVIRTNVPFKFIFEQRPEG